MARNPPPISVQLYSLREECMADFDNVLQKLADIGYCGVEPFHLFGKTPIDFATQVEGLGMKVSSSHYPWANHGEANEVANVVKQMGLSRAAAGYGPADFKTADDVQRTVENINQIVERLKKQEVELFLHNHWFEFVPVSGELPYHTLQRECPDLLFEVDTYWAANFGECDPVAEVKRIQHRAPLLHIKDGPLVRDQAHVAVGQGAMDIPGVCAAADDDTIEWLIVELDACDTDMFTAVTESFEYLVSNGLAAGKIGL